MNNNSHDVKHRYVIHLIYAATVLLVTLLVLGYHLWRRGQINSCIARVTAEYSGDWSHACHKVAEDIQRNVENCVNSNLFPPYDNEEQRVAFCRTINGTPDFSNDCLLPAAMANDINNRLEKGKDLCSR